MNNIEEMFVEKLSKICKWLENFAELEIKSVFNYKGNKVEMIGKKIFGMDHGEFEYNIEVL